MTRPSDPHVTGSEPDAALGADLRAIAADLDAALRRDARRRRRRGRAAKLAGVGVGCAALLSGTAVAADEAGIITLPGGLRAQPLPPAPVERIAPSAGARTLVCDGDECRPATAAERAELRRARPGEYRYRYRITRRGMTLDWHTEVSLADDPDAVGDGTLRIDPRGYSNSRR
jgi:hypothetical protein